MSEPDLFPKPRRASMAALRRKAEEPFIRNEYGLWCPNCQEAIDESWPASCDHCGYPKPDHDRCDGDDLDDADDRDFEAFLGGR